MDRTQVSGLGQVEPSTFQVEVGATWVGPLLGPFPFLLLAAWNVDVRAGVEQLFWTTR